MPHILYSSAVLTIGKETVDGCRMCHIYDVINSYKFAFYKHRGRYKVRYIDVDWRVLFGSYNIDDDGLAGSVCLTRGSSEWSNKSVVSIKRT